MAQRRIGILGGTFDPVHLGHLLIASELAFALRLEQVRFVPAGDPPHKPEQRLSPIADRLEMLQLAIADRPLFAIDRVDLDRPGPSFTHETLEGLQIREPDAGFWFLMGADSLRDLPTWQQPERILDLAEIGVATRPGVRIDLPALYGELPSARSRVSIVSVPLIEVSSRDIRARIATARPVAFHVPAAVETYIDDHGLYQTAVERTERVSTTDGQLTLG